jgi:archaellum component FlaC
MTVETIDVAGVTFSAIQQLAKENEALRDQPAEQEKQIQALSEQMEKIRTQIGGGAN